MTRRLAVAIGLCLQTLAMLAVLLPHITLLNGGTQATLRTVPVDPLSILRGEYVMLSYEAGQNMPTQWNGETRVYVVLEPKDGLYQQLRISDVPPQLLPGQICIRGTQEYGRISFDDIAQYFVPEHGSDDIITAQREHRLLVDIAVDSSCRAAIRGLRLDPTPVSQSGSAMVPLVPIRR